MRKLTEVEKERRFMARVRFTSECWEWVGALTPAGYGQFSAGSGSPRMAHRYLYERTSGPVSAGLHLDHLCRNRACVRPDHLEPVTPRENQLRGFGAAGANARKTHCPNGHEYDGTYTDPSGSRTRTCSTCIRARRRSPAYRQRSRERARRYRAERNCA